MKNLYVSMFLMIVSIGNPSSIFADDNDSLGGKYVETLNVKVRSQTKIQTENGFSLKWYCERDGSCKNESLDLYDNISTAIPGDPGAGIFLDTLQLAGMADYDTVLDFGSSTRPVHLMVHKTKLKGGRIYYDVELSSGRYKASARMVTDAIAEMATKEKPKPTTGDVATVALVIPNDDNSNDEIEVVFEGRSVKGE